MFHRYTPDPLINRTREEVTRSTFPQGTSVKNIRHYHQSVQQVNFAMFDYGFLNMHHYRQRSAPDYDLSAISSEHIAIITSHDDEFATPKNVQRFRHELKGQRSRIVQR